MDDTGYMNYADLEDFFKDHPDDEDEFLDELARLENEKGPIDYPEDWPMCKYA